MGAQYRAEKKARRQARIEAAGNEEPSSQLATASVVDDNGSESDSEEEESEEEEDEEDRPAILEHTPWGPRSQLGRFVPSTQSLETPEPEDDEGGTRKKSRAGLPRWKPKPRSKLQLEKDHSKTKDLFKAMDGSALLVLGATALSIVETQN